MADIHSAADDSLTDEDYAQSTTTSYVSSIASDIRKGIEENGRTYAAYGSHEYGMPIDDVEQDCADFQHCKFTLILSGRLHLSPISPSPQRILDLGTGSGIWAIDMADKHPSASVIGADIAAVQPQWVPPNLQFEIEDVENDWLWPKDSFDFIHARELIFAIRDWPRLIRQSLELLKPGGYLELAATVPLVSCDNGTLPANTAYKQLETVFFDIGHAMGASADAALLWKKQMDTSGFADVRETVFKIPTNPWPKDKRLKEIGALEYMHFRDGIDAYFLRGCVQYLGMHRVQLEALLAQAKREIQNRNMHSYILL